MKKVCMILIVLFTAVFFGSGCSANDEPAASENIEIILTINKPVMLVNGAEQRIDENNTAPVIISDRTLLPVRAIVEAMGGTAEWNESERTVTLTKGKDVIRLVIDEPEAYLNDEAEVLDSPPVIINGRTMLPIRFIAESFNFSVEWKGEESTVIITGNSADEAHAADNLKEQKTINVTVNGNTFTAALENNETAAAFYEMLPLTLEMDELNGNEKYYYLDESLPSRSQPVGRIQTGDLMLYGTDCIVSFFKSFDTPYSYTPIGRIENAEGYASALGSGTVTVLFGAN